MSKGYVNLVLHAHLPFVYAAGNRHHLEERWFFEALTESYLPLLLSLDRLSEDRVPFALTLSLSPSLLAMLDHPVLARRYEDYLQRLIRLAEQETIRTRSMEEYHHLARFYLDRLQKIHRAYTVTYNCDLTSAFARLCRTEKLELITTCATHGYLPLLKTPEAVRAQVGIGLEAFATRFGFYPRGIWLPECGYFSGLDHILAEKNVEYCFVDTHGVQNAWPTPRHDVYAPVQTAAGVAVFARDPETSSQVWSLHSGYPGDENYREYYRDIGFELDEDYIKQYLPYPVRVNTGMKYWRVTGGEGPKEPYNPHRAQQKALEHAQNFHFNRERQIEYLQNEGNQSPVVTAPYDAELFGHWWFEGPDFLEQLFRHAAEHQDVYTFTTPSGYIDAHGSGSRAELTHSSWGEGGYSQVWLNPKNDWLYPPAHQAETCLIRQATAHPDPDDAQKRALTQMGRELLLVQSSDWAFMLNAGTTDNYARSRFNCHLENFRRLDHMLSEGRVLLDEVTAMETDASGLFPGMHTRAYAPEPLTSAANLSENPATLMLSWEYPPQIMGGLARHVDDLSQTLCEMNQPVSVLTSHAGDMPAQEINGGVQVYRVAPYQRAGEEIDFHDWVMQLNLVFFNFAQHIVPANQFAVLHAHDWLVGTAALGMKRFWRLPLVATIHATEYGRNGGLFTPLQKQIHQHEQKLVDGADRVICCSEYMAREVCRLFDAPAEKITVIENGVMQEKVAAKPFSRLERQQYAREDEAIIFFVGRLVREKGVEVLLRALPAVFAAHPKTRAVISGKGPMLESLKQQAKDLGIAAKVTFTGFITDTERNRLLAAADIAVFPSLYEPFGIVALEAMIAETPVVVSDVGGMGEVVIDGVDGLKCPPGNTKALSSCIRTLLEDKKLSARLAKQGKEKATTTFSWDTLAQKTKQVYREVWEAARLPEPQSKEEDYATSTGTG
ncbi:1,4-alpha-glucan branching protein domain-containing protein [Dethiobacter alkaliphilus]|uniref:Glycosyl transferase group 1 n=1 Tax=Dethiobacter alkaliphilus AHT 1 TaxID=555088 RepID=C0GDS5_DETAL|nr:1,4-alpha-glucan branching protein domain-containing protein [Dethiobacter alkaliphilus]EEG78558.1 glycosyl transferase group 1 [Dethiobacter alkaliphilus AHT 1]